MNYLAAIQNSNSHVLVERYWVLLLANGRVHVGHIHLMKTLLGTTVP